ncbi:MAG: rRNA maturation RNase YbeY [Duncaniella sp.]|nr:rRNA maturation RNase YbeY [Duncaniella sp.]
MSQNIEWTTAGSVAMPNIRPCFLDAWISLVAGDHGYTVGKLRFIFCDDEEILRINREFLHHDYYTDIITFDYTRKDRVSGEMFISLDTVASNAKLVGTTYDRELLRVIIHGVLHLCGINDKGPGEREIMEAHENEALDRLQALLFGLLNENSDRQK